MTAADRPTLARLREVADGRPAFDAAAERKFWSKVERTPTCWLWTDATSTRGGYGQLTIHRNGRRWTMRAHRGAYELLRGEIPEGKVLDHICRVPSCVNPDHLRPVDNATNVLIGIGLSAINARKTHCKRGHEFTPENTYTPPSKPNVRWCRTCRRKEQSERWKSGNLGSRTDLVACPHCSKTMRRDSLRRHVVGYCRAVLDGAPTKEAK